MAAKFYQYFKCHIFVALLMLVIYCSIFALSILQNVCSIHAVNVCSINPAKCLHPQTTKKITYPPTAPLQKFAASTHQKIDHLPTLSNVCNIHPAKCLQHPPCKMLAAWTQQNNTFTHPLLQNVCSINPAKNSPLNPPLQMFAIFTVQYICSIHPAKCLQHPPCKMLAAWTQQKNTFTHPPLQNVCSVHPAKCLQLNPCKMFAASKHKKKYT